MNQQSLLQLARIHERSFIDWPSIRQSRRVEVDEGDGSVWDPDGFKLLFDAIYEELLEGSLLINYNP